MLMYGILAAVLVVAIAALVVLKKRKEAETNGPTEKKAATSKAKNKAKGKASSAESASTDSDESRSTPVPDELRRQIENLIRQQNYFSAEAQINQALNKNSSQHELYLMLLELHLLQNDDFAIKQLFEHIRSLKLDDLLVRAEDKRQKHDAEIAAQKEAEKQFRRQNSTTVVEAAPAQKADFDFDSLISQPKPKQEQNLGVESQTPPPLSFQTNPTEPFKEAKIETPSMDFDFSAKPKAEPIVEAKVEAPSMDFDFSAKPKAEPVVEAKIEAPSMDFDFSAKPKAEPVVEAKVEAPSMDFDFSAKPKAEPVVEAKVEAPSMDFDFSAKPKAEPVVEAKVEAPSMDFGLKPQTPVEPVVEATLIEATMDMDFDFSPKSKTSPVVESKVEAAKMDFDLKPQTPAEPVVEATLIEATMDMDFDFNPKPKTEPVAETKIDATKMDFDLKPQTPAEPVVEATLIEATTDMDFDFNPKPKTEPVVETKAEAPKIDLSATTEANTEAVSKTETSLMDFDFYLKPEPQEKAAPEVKIEESVTPPPVEAPIEEPQFNFNSAPQDIAKLASESVQKDEIELNFSDLKLDASKAVLDLNAETAAKATKQEPALSQVIEPLDFSFSLDEPETGFSAPKKEAPTAATVTETVTDSKLDPLEKAFPELATLNEAMLDLDLAQQYIELGAYDAARALIAENEAHYSAEQRQIADQLLNKIAS